MREKAFPEVFMVIDPSRLDAIGAILTGFAFAGLVASAFEAATRRPATFRLLQTGDVAALASVPVIVFCAPFLILRGLIGRRRHEPRPIAGVFSGTVIACLWSMACGRLVLDATALLGAP